MRYLTNADDLNRNSLISTLKMTKNGNRGGEG